MLSKFLQFCYIHVVKGNGYALMMLVYIWSNHTKKQAVHNVVIAIPGLVLRLSCVRDKSHAQIPDLRVEVQHLKDRNYGKTIFTLPMFSLFLKPLTNCCIHSYISGNIIDYDIYFKALIHCLELQKGKVLFGH